MLAAGDEFGRTQRGNNNAYCQDNPTSWLSWETGPEGQQLLAFASGTLISALAFELFPEAVELGGLRASGWGLLAGAATFVVVNAWLDSRVARGGRGHRAPPRAGRVRGRAA